MKWYSIYYIYSQVWPFAYNLQPSNYDDILQFSEASLADIRPRTVHSFFLLVSFKNGEAKKYDRIFGQEQADQ